MSRFDYIVLGSGVAGLRAAIELSDKGDVALITKCFFGESSSEYAQGGVAVVLNDDDDIALHYDDTLNAGDGLCDEKAVMTLVEEGPAYINELISWGAQFDMHGGMLEFTKEAAHSVNRIIHAKGDATGHEIVRSLKEYSTTKERLFRIEKMYAVDFIMKDDRVTGVLTIDENTGEFHTFSAKAVVVATGGAGRLFTRTTNPNVSTGDGMAMAFRAGAKLRDMEMFQFHPTGLHFPGAPAFLLSESMRGEGALLKNSDGKRFALDYHKDGELAPRDVVSRAIFFEMEKMETNHMYLDVTHLGEDFVRNRWPKIYKTCFDFGLDITVDFIPISPAAHYYMGGVWTDIDGRTSIKGLYACGESACTGVHGANRLASNSLLEGVVFGGRSAKAAIADCDALDVQEINAEIGETVIIEDADKRLLELETVMWKNVSVARNEEGLKTAVDYLDKLIAEFKGKRPANRKTAELLNLAEVGRLMAGAGLARTASRGGHYRSDFPEKSTDKSHIAFQNAEFTPIKE